VWQGQNPISTADCPNSFSEDSVPCVRSLRFKVLDAATQDSGG